MIAWMRGLALCLMSLSSLTLAVEAPSTVTLMDGRAIAEAQAQRDAGFADTVVELTMTMSNAEGRERRRQLTWQTLEVPALTDGDKSLATFLEPKDIEGTAFLSHTHVDRDDDQWLYLPALKRVKRIASSNKSSPFVGSEFAYEDLLSDEVEKFDYTRLTDEACGEWLCFVLERRARYANSGYSRQVVWLEQEAFRLVKIEFYDQKERHRKTLTFTDYRLYLGRFWRAHRLRMENHLSAKVTELDFEDFRFQTGLGPRDLDPSALRRIR